MARGTEARRSIWSAQLVTIMGLVVYVAAVYAIAPALPRGGVVSLGVGAALALVPMGLWLMLFYAQDAREPEPLGHVGRVAAAGALLAAALAVPLRAVLAATSWLTWGPLPVLAVSVLVVGGVQEFCKYLAVRFTVFDLDEFDEVVDGVIYGTAAGLGVAATLSLTALLAGPSVAPVTAALAIVVTSLSQAASGGVLGYALGRAKMHGEYGRVGGGYVLAAILNGVVAFAVRGVIQDGFTPRPWYGLVVAAGVAVAVTLALLRAVTAAPPDAGGGGGAGSRGVRA